MYHIIKKYSLLLMFIFSLLTIAGCSGKNENAVSIKDSLVAENENHDENPSLAALTETQMKTVGIELGNIELKELTATIKANGVLKVPNSKKGNATSLFGGSIQNINVQIGDYVNKGQVVATITNPQFIAMQEEYLTLNSKIVYASQEMQRQKELNEGNAGARKNLQSATAEYNELRTRKASLEKQISMMGIDPNNISNNSMRSSLVVTSPLSGTVSNVFAKIGSYVDVTSPVIEVVDNSSLHLDLQVFEKDLPKIKEGQVIHFTLTNNPTKEYDAKVFSIGSSFENDSKTIAIHCAVTGNKNGLIDGMNITGLVSLDHATTPAVPSDAIVESDGKYYIFVQADNMNDADIKDTASQNEKHFYFEKIEIIKGVSDLGYTAITLVKDISAATKIVTKGAFFINAKLVNTEGHEH